MFGASVACGQLVEMRSMTVFARDYDQNLFEPKGDSARRDTRTMPVQMSNVHTRAQFTLLVLLANTH